MFKVCKSTDIERKLPILSVENGCLISKHADITVAFKVELPEIFTLSILEYEKLHQALLVAISSLPDYTVLHKQDWYRKTSYEPNQKESDSFLTAAYKRHFTERPYLTQECYFFITKYSRRRAGTHSLFTSLTQGKIIPSDTLDERVTDDFLDKVESFARTIEGTGLVKLYRLQDIELTGCDQSGKAGILEKYLSLSQDEQETVLRDIHLERGLQVGEKYCQMYTISQLEDLPDEVQTTTKFDPFSSETGFFPISFAASIGLLMPTNHLVNQYIFKDSREKTISKLEGLARNLQSLSSFGRENRINRDWTNKYLEEAHQKDEAPIRFHANVLTWIENGGDSLQQQRNQASSAISEIKGCKPRLASVDIGTFFWAGIPGNACDLPREDTFYTFIGQAACFFPLESPAKVQSLEPELSFGIRLAERLSGVPVKVDISDAPMKSGKINNRNKFILGPSGSGKSFFTNDMVSQYLEQDSHVLIVDVGNSYEGIAELYEAVHFRYTKEKPIAFNPFYLPEGEEKPDLEKSESIATLLLTLWKKADELPEKSEEVSISDSIKEYYDEYLSKNPREFPCFNTYYKFVDEIFRQSLASRNVREKDFDLDSYLYVLRPFSEGGQYDYLLNSKDNLDLVSESFVIFELDNIKDHKVLLPVVTLMIMETFIAKMRRLQGIRKMILIEEAWAALAQAGMASYLKYLFKTVRKFFGEAVVVTQDVEDLLSSPVVQKAILSNADTKILLDQSKFRLQFDEIQQVLGLSDADRTKIFSMNKGKAKGRNYKDVFIALGTHSRVYSVEVSPEQYYTFTTEEKEKESLKDIKHRLNTDIRGAIESQL